MGGVATLRQKMAALLNVEMDGVAQVMQYEDDSVEAWFTDGARIVLTACAASFTRQDGPEKDGNLPRKASTFHQFTAYAVRECRDRVRQLVAFRNCFAERPFLSSSLLDPEVDLQVSDNVCQYAAWPSSLELATSCKLIQTSSSGSSHLLSSDGLAWAELACHGQTLTTCYLARLPPDSGSSSSSIEALENKTEALGLSDGVEETRGTYQYTWTTALHSTASIPDAWRHPLSLLLQHREQCSHVTVQPPVLKEEEKENGRLDAVDSSPLPHTLPLTCHNSHLHHRHSSQGLILKVLLTEGILYRLLSKHSVPFVEALPNQNTVLRSHDSQGRFFECWCVDEASGSVRHSMYCVDYPPTSTGLPFSMSRVLGQASRLLGQALKLTGLHPPLCWKAPSPLPSPPSSPLHYSVPGLGQFAVHANGHVRCVFADRTIIDFYDPRGHCATPTVTSASGQKSTLTGILPCTPGGVRTRGVEVARGVWIGEHLCRVMQPNGRYVMLSTQHPAHFHRYIEVVKEWCEWLARPEGERGDFCQGAIYDQHTQRQVLAELSKIGQFNAIMTSQPTTASRLANSGCGQSMSPFVRDALQRTADVVQDIDTLLGK